MKSGYLGTRINYFYDRIKSTHNYLWDITELKGFEEGVKLQKYSSVF